jgi:hypothetical protein
MASPSPPGSLLDNWSSVAQSFVWLEPQWKGTSRRVYAVLGIVLILFVLLASIIAIKTPAWESADEPDHVENVEAIVDGHWYGMDTHCASLSTLTGRSCGNDEAQQAPLYYLGMAAWQKVVALDPRPVPKLQFSRTLIAGDSELFASHSSSDHRFLLWLRFPNIALGVSTVFVVFLAIRRVSRDPWTPVVAAAVLAFLPRFVFLSAFVSNDNLVNLLGAVLGYLALRFITSSNIWNMAWVGVSFGLLVATKLSALPMGLVIVVIVFFVPTWKRRLSLLAVAGGGAVLTCGWYLIQNTVRYGDPLATTESARWLQHNGGLGTFNHPYRVTDPLGLFFWHVPMRIVNTFWYTSGWAQFHWTTPVNLTITAVVLVIVVGIIGQKIPRIVILTLAALSVAALLCVWVVSTQTATYQGRYALVGGVGIAGLIAFGLQRWHLPVRFLVPAAGLCGTCIAIQSNVLSVHWT